MTSQKNVRDPLDYGKECSLQSSNTISAHITKITELCMPFVKLILYLSLCLWISLLLALMTHIVFYRSYVPTALQIIPLNFKFDSACFHGDAQIRLWSVQQNLLSVSHDTKSASTTALLASTCTLPHYRINFTENQLFVDAQSYRLVMRMNVPHTELNRRSGVFMISIRMFDKKYEQILETSKPIMLPHRSWLIDQLDTVIFGPFYLVGLLDQSTRFEFPLLEDFVDDPIRRSVSLEVTIHSTTVQIPTGELQIHAQYRGVQWLFYHFPIISAIFSCVFFTLLYFPLILLVFHQNIWNHLGRCLVILRIVTPSDDSTHYGEVLSSSTKSRGRSASLSSSAYGSQDDETICSSSLRSRHSLLTDLSLKIETS